MADEGRHRHDLVTCGQLRADEKVDHFNRITSREMFFTQAFQVSDRSNRPWSLSGDIKAQIIFTCFSVSITIGSGRSRPSFVAFCLIDHEYLLPDARPSETGHFR